MDARARMEEEQERRHAENEFPKFAALGRKLPAARLEPDSWNN